MLSAAFLFSIGTFLPAFSWHSLLCLRKIKQKSAQYKARIRLNSNTRFGVKSTWFRHSRWNTTRKRLMFLCSAFQTYVHLCGRMSKVYGKSLGMSPYVSLKISHISLISLISHILRGTKQKKSPWHHDWRQGLNSEKKGGLLLSRIALQYHRRRRA